MAVLLYTTTAVGIGKVDLALEIEVSYNGKAIDIPSGNYEIVAGGSGSKSGLESKPALDKSDARLKFEEAVERYQMKDTTEKPTTGRDWTLHNATKEVNKLVVGKKATSGVGDDLLLVRLDTSIFSSVKKGLAETVEEKATELINSGTHPIDAVRQAFNSGVLDDSTQQAISAHRTKAK